MGVTANPIDTWLRQQAEHYELRTLPPALRAALASLFEHIFEAASEAYDSYPPDPTWAHREELGTVVRTRGSKNPGLRMIRDPKAFWLVRSQVPRRLDAIVQEIRHTLGVHEG